VQQVRRSANYAWNGRAGRLQINAIAARPPFMQSLDSMTVRYEEYVQALVPLEAMDPKVFIGGEDASQKLCNFILALALVYNDFKVVIVGHHAVDTVEPKNLMVKTPEVGMFNAVRIGMFRLHAGIFRELFDLIYNNADVLAEPFFSRLERKLTSEGRAHWQALCDIASSRPKDNPELKALLLVRNKVAFHYDPAALFAGYRMSCVDDVTNPPLVSRGNTMQATHFFFADAAAMSYMSEAAEQDALMDILCGRSPLTHRINVALYELVTKFVAERGFAWKTASA